MQYRSALDRALIAVVQEPAQRTDDLAAALSAAPPEFARVVTEHGLGGLAHRHCVDLASRFPGLVAELNMARKEAWTRHLIAVTDLRTVVAALNGSGAAWAVVKGPVLAELAYERPDQRRYLDIDVLVHPAAFGAALASLEAAGSELIDRNWTLIRSSMRGELSLRINKRTSLDLHWHLLNDASMRARASWQMDALLERTVEAQIGGMTVPVLEPVDALVHLATHACLAGAHRLMWLKDIERQLARFPVSVPELEERARAAQLWPHVAVSILRMANTFNLQPPDRLPAWAHVNRLAGCDRFRTHRGLLGTGRTLADTTRASVGPSLHALADTAGRGLIKRLPAAVRQRVPVAPTYDVLRSPGGTMADRSAYLEAVATTVGR